MNATAKNLAVPSAATTVIGLDIAKNIFVAVGLDRHGKTVYRRTMARGVVLSTFANMVPVAIGIESCAGAHYWARELIALGHHVKLIAAQHVTAFVTGNKNDTRDAAAIAEVRSRQSTKYVPINTVAQQELQMMHRARAAVQKTRVAMINRIRAFAYEMGKTFAVGVAKFHVEYKAWIASDSHGLSDCAQLTFQDLYSDLNALDRRMESYDERLKLVSKTDERAKRLMRVPGIGPVTATAMLAAVSDAHHFGSGRDFAANLGLTPHEHSSGGKQRLYGISKRGDVHLRTLLIHGARSALRTAEGKLDAQLRWAKKIEARRGFNVAAVALANKTARLVWAMLAYGREYVPAWSKTMTSPV